MKPLILIVITLILILSGCDGFLDQKPRQSLVVPRELPEFQALLDNTSQVFNTVPGGFVYASDELKITASGFDALIMDAREFYSWNPEAFMASEAVGDWNVPYRQILIANVVIDGLENFPVDLRTPEWKRIKAQALFQRAFGIFNVLQLFAAPYHPSHANETLGLPYPNSSNINQRFGRENLEATYQKMIRDFEDAAADLPENIIYTTRPSKPAAYLMLAKIYLSMFQFQLAEDFASQSLNLKNDIMDYNNLNPNLARPIPGFNEEEIYYASQILISQFSNQIYFDDSFMDLYEENDLRKEIFFQTNAIGLTNFKGSYTGNLLSYGGLAVDETIFVLAEAKIRNNKLVEASDLLNSFLEKRFGGGVIVPLNFETESEPLMKLHTEKRKQMVFRGVRWADLRRLTSEGIISDPLVKEIGNQTVTLAPMDPRWTYPIPFGEISRHEIPQNPR